MAEAELERRMRLLTDMFQTPFTLVDPPEDEADQCKEVQDFHFTLEPEPELQAAFQAQDETQWAHSEGPQKFVTSDAGPRAQTEGAFDCFEFKKGEPVGEDMEFCPWKAVRAYPGNFIGNTNRPHAEPFFEKIYEGRVWDFFYLHHPTKPREKPFLFVPTAQFQAFLDYINKELGIALAIPGGVNSDRFFMRFGQGGTPRPRYFKRLRDRKSFEVDRWPGIDIKDTEAFMAASPMQQDDLNNKLRLTQIAPTKDKKQRAKERSALKKADREHMLDEAQTLLGLKGDKVVNGGKKGDDVVFVCVDIEAIERPPNPVSEVGIAILDSKDMQEYSPGPCGMNWWPLFKNFHLRTKEYSGLVNREFVQGCPDAFDFGKSTFPPRAKLADAVMSILNPYVEASREIILVGHDAKQDVQYLSAIGVEISDIPCITRVLDSQTIHQAWKQLDNGRGLHSVLSNLGINSKNLHNAGNDAVYTLRAFIGVCTEQIRQQKAEERGEEYEPALLAAW